MPETPVTPPVSRSIHAPLIEQSLPAWVTAATAPRRAQFKQADAPLPDWYLQATPAQRKALGDAAVASFSAQTDLDETSPGSYEVGLPSIIADERALIVKLTSEAMQRAKLQRTEIPFHLAQGNGELHQNRK
ncbi:MAG: hypothetical protein CFE47_17430 [Pseudomonas sp. PGPPP1]|uniref:hypothetical protein n=1 Tax=Pseudomonas sp. PGPPP1 TaxID=2015553 RepID=UPI000BDBF18C|nr:hypothetical protein [Pseudomonas sp. PGPPP1]OYU06215.1 MAG: hypothetical protein CFE47_17430 [Pseudomonas sp. PGPPP1]